MKIYFLKKDFILKKAPETSEKVYKKFICPHLLNKSKEYKIYSEKSGNLLFK